MTRSFAIAPNVISEVVDGEAVLLDLRSGTYFALNRVATRIWELLQLGAAETALRTTLLNEFDVADEALENDVNVWLRELEARGLIATTPEG